MGIQAKITRFFGDGTASNKDHELNALCRGSALTWFILDFDQTHELTFTPAFIEVPIAGPCHLPECWGKRPKSLLKAMRHGNGRDTGLRIKRGEIKSHRSVDCDDYHNLYIAILRHLHFLGYFINH